MDPVATTIDPQAVSLSVATLHDAPTLANLLELYAHDLSSTFALELGVDGRFGYPKLPLYWSEPERRFPFLIHCGSRIAGFALVTRGSPASEDPEDLDVAEFFIARRYRRSGVGRRAAFLLWDRFAGRWIVRVSEGNHGGCDFWDEVITEYTKCVYTKTVRSGSPHSWCVFAFESSRQRGAARVL
jgi:predicted acetyltransferase